MEKSQSKEGERSEVGHKGKMKGGLQEVTSQDSLMQN